MVSVSIFLSQKTMQTKATSLKWAIGFSGFLTLFKGGVGLFCASASLVASALDSLMDMGISSVNYIAVQKGAKPPDEGHAYGHEKIESLASYTQGMAILFFAFLFLGEVFRRALARSGVFHSEIALLTIGLAALVNLVLVAILHQAQRRTGSLILKVEETHYSMDLFSYLLIFLAVGLVRWTNRSGWDLLGGILLAFYVAFLVVKILIQAANELVDHSLARSSLEELDTLIRRHDPRVLSYHEMRTRRAGHKTFVDFHLVMKPDQSFQEAHEVTESLIQKIKSKFQNVDVTVHEDPEGGI